MRHPITENWLYSPLDYDSPPCGMTTNQSSAWDEAAGQLRLLRASITTHEPILGLTFDLVKLSLFRRDYFGAAAQSTHCATTLWEALNLKGIFRGQSAFPQKLH